MLAVGTDRRRADPRRDGPTLVPPGGRLPLRLAGRNITSIPINALQLLGPGALGGPSEYFGHENYWESVTSIGLVPLVLAVVAVAWSGDRRGVRGWLLLVGAGVLFASGRKLGLFALLYEVVPGMDRFRVPARSLFLASLGASMLAGMGVEALRARREDSRAWARLARRFAVAASVLVIVRRRIGVLGSLIPPLSPRERGPGEGVAGPVGTESDRRFLGTSRRPRVTPASLPGEREEEKSRTGSTSDGMRTALPRPDLPRRALGSRSCWRSVGCVPEPSAGDRRRAGAARAGRAGDSRAWPDRDDARRPLPRPRPDRQRPSRGRALPGSSRRGSGPSTRSTTTSAPAVVGFSKANVNDSFQIQHAADLYQSLYRTCSTTTGPPSGPDGAPQRPPPDVSPGPPGRPRPDGRLAAGLGPPRARLPPGRWSTPGRCGTGEARPSRHLPEPDGPAARLRRPRARPATDDSPRSSPLFLGGRPPRGRADAGRPARPRPRRPPGLHPGGVGLDRPRPVVMQVDDPGPRPARRRRHLDARLVGRGRRPGLPRSSGAIAPRGSSPCPKPAITRST